MDRRATIFVLAAVSLTTLVFATVLAVVKSGGCIRAAGLQETNGDESVVVSSPYA